MHDKEGAIPWGRMQRCCRVRDQLFHHYGKPATFFYQWTYVEYPCPIPVLQLEGKLKSLYNNKSGCLAVHGHLAFDLGISCGI